jgi:hypothetical protein
MICVHDYELTSEALEWVRPQPAVPVKESGESRHYPESLYELSTSNLFFSLHFWSISNKATFLLPTTRDYVLC